MEGPKLTMELRESHIKAVRSRNFVACQGSSRSLQCVDLFAGAGGLSLAAGNAGMEIVAAVEFNKHACATYRDNLVEDDRPKLYETDIRTLDPKELVRNLFDCEVERDIVLGGPPCQGFSQHRFKDAGVSDPRNELILKYFEFVEVLRPKVFLMENVPGMMWPRHQGFRKTFYEQGRNAGYWIWDPETLDARDYSVPQRRKRLFILGIRNDVEFDGKWPPARTHGHKDDRLRNPELLPWADSRGVFSFPVEEGDEKDIHALPRWIRRAQRRLRTHRSEPAWPDHDDRLHQPLQRTFRAPDRASRHYPKASGTISNLPRRFRVQRRTHVRRGTDRQRGARQTGRDPVTRGCKWVI